MAKLFINTRETKKMIKVAINGAQAPPYTVTTVSIAVGIANDTIKKQRSHFMDMKFSTI